MNKISLNLKYLVVFALILGFSSVAQSKRKRKTKKPQLMVSIKAAVQRSDKDQDRIKDQMNSEADQRIESWQAREMEAIQIKHSGTSSLEPVDLGDPDFSMEDLGEDTSGLNRLRTDIEEEPTDINFDEELREVSSMKD